MEAVTITPKGGGGVVFKIMLGKKPFNEEANRRQLIVLELIVQFQ